jgi:hypothetical protein
MQFAREVLLSIFAYRRAKRPKLGGRPVINFCEGVERTLNLPHCPHGLHELARKAITRRALRRRRNWQLRECKKESETDDSLRHRVRLTIGDFDTVIVSREDLIIAKLLWCRETRSTMTGTAPCRDPVPRPPSREVERGTSDDGDARV